MTQLLQLSHQTPNTDVSLGSTRSAKKLEYCRCESNLKKILNEMLNVADINTLVDIGS